jgi:hypothetical protein
MMRRSRKIIIWGIVLVFLGIGSMQRPSRTVIERDETETRRRTDAIPTTPIITPQINATRTPLPVTVLPTATTLILPTARPISMDTVLLSGAVYRDAFTNIESGWEPYYVGDGGAWNGYESGRYAFQLANAPTLAAGRRLWDFNTSGVIDGQYRIGVEVESQTPQRGLVITEYAGDFVNMNSATGLFVLFEVGYAMQPRPNPIQVAVLDRGSLMKLSCKGDAALVVGPRMKMSVTVVEGLVIVSLMNRDNDQSSSVRCGWQTLSSGNRWIGIGAVRAIYQPNQIMSPLAYTDVEVAGINRYITDNIPEIGFETITAGCRATPVYTFDEWLTTDVLEGCTVY